MCADIALHDKNDGNPHAHILLTMRPLNEDKTWGAKSKKEYILDENGEKVKLKNGNFKTRKIDTVDWNEQDKAEEWRKSWADITNKYLEENSIQEKVDHRSYLLFAKLFDGSFFNLIDAEYLNLQGCRQIS